jgi:subtilisin-like proprotein convertase family protein
MPRRLNCLALLTLTAFLLSVSSAAAIPVPFDISGLGQADVDTNPGTEVDLTSLVTGTILDLNVTVEITGGHMEDLDLFLTSPGGTTVQFRRNFWTPFLHQDPPLSATFDDQAAATHDSQPADSPVIGTFQPFAALSVFNGQQLAGLWTLTILDTFVPDEGDDLLSWSITGRVETDQVPEPATLGLFAGALGWFAVRRRQRVATV